MSSAASPGQVVERRRAGIGDRNRVVVAEDAGEHREVRRGVVDRQDRRRPAEVQRRDAAGCRGGHLAGIDPAGRDHDLEQSDHPRGLGAQRDEHPGERLAGLAVAQRILHHTRACRQLVAPSVAARLLAVWATRSASDQWWAARRSANSSGTVACVSTKPWTRSR